MIRSVRTLIFLRAVPVLLIKVLADLKKRRAALFYRHLGPHGPKEGNAFASRAAAPHPNHSHPENPENPGNPDSDNKKRATGIKPMARLLSIRNARDRI